MADRLGEILEEIAKLEQMGLEGQEWSFGAQHIFPEARREPGGVEALVRRFGASKHAATASGVSYAILLLADDHASPEVANLVYEFVDGMSPGGFNPVTDATITGNCLQAVTCQTHEGLPWVPTDGPAPPALARIVLMGLRSDETYAGGAQYQAKRTLATVSNWATKNGHDGLRWVFSAVERAELRAAIDTGFMARMKERSVLKALGDG